MNSTRLPTLRSTLADLCVWVFLFLLAMGQIQLTTLNIKIGGNIEHLFPLLLLSVLLRWPKVPVIRLDSFGPALLLLGGGILCGTLASFSISALEDPLRLLFRALSGLLVASWLWNHSREPTNRWDLAWLSGLLVQAGLTIMFTVFPDQTGGPFGNRSIQTAFLLLALPLTCQAGFRAGSHRTLRLLMVGLIITYQLVFLLISQSRSALFGYAVAMVLGVYGFLSLLKSRRWLYPLTLIGACAVLGAGLIAGYQRFAAVPDDLLDPYHCSRAVIWAGVANTWQDPALWLVGTGADDQLRQSVLGSPAGNISFQYRAAAGDAHSFLLQIRGLGGIPALFGWLLLLLPFLQILSREDSHWMARLMACLVGGVIANDLFHSTLSHAHVMTLLWIHIGMLGLYAHQLATWTESESGENPPVPPDTEKQTDRPNGGLLPQPILAERPSLPKEPNA